MKSISSAIFLILYLFLASSCKKEAGEGGTSSIRGKVYAKYYDKYFYAVSDSSYAPDIDVYIIYGDEFTFGERQRTSYNGSYEFKYLRKGAYTIYAYSKDSTGAYKNQVNVDAADVAIIKKVDVTKPKQTVEVPDINIVQ